MSYEVKKGDTVIFKQRIGRSKFARSWDYEDGDVVWVSDDKKSFNVLWREGHHSRNDDVPLEDIVAVVDTSVEKRTQIGHYRGQFIILQEILEPGT